MIIIIAVMPMIIISMFHISPMLPLFGFERWQYTTYISQIPIARRKMMGAIKSKRINKSGKIGNVITKLYHNSRQLIHNGINQESAVIKECEYFAVLP